MKKKNAKQVCLSYQIKVTDMKVFRNLFFLLGKLAIRGVRKVDIIIQEPKRLLPIEEIAKKISGLRYHYKDKLAVRLENFPFCFVKQPDSFVFFKKKGRNYFSKPAQCQNCKYNLHCFGIARNFQKFMDTRNIKAVPDLPGEIMIEIEEKCNLDCRFCFNKNSFAKKGRNIKNELTISLVKKIIQDIAQANIPIVRFTGGEPLLNKNIFKVSNYAKKKGLETRLNTNGLLITSKVIARKISSHFDNVLISFQLDEILKNKKIRDKKIRAIKLLKEAKVKKLRVDTVITKKMIYNFTKIYRFIKSINADKWELNRPILNREIEDGLDSESIKELVEKLISIKRKTGETHYIINALPFCAYDPVKVQAIAVGAYACDGHERFVIDPRGFAKPIYYMDKNIGDPQDILSCWNHPFMKKMRNLEYVPNECRNCIYLDKCRGGCRFSAHFFTKSYMKLDPLANISNKIITK